VGILITYGPLAILVDLAVDVLVDGKSKSQKWERGYQPRKSKFVAQP